MSYTVFKQCGDRWIPISRAFPLQSQAENYQADLPLDWKTEVRETN